MLSRQVRRAQAREAAKPKHLGQDWRRAIMTPDYDPPHRRGVSDKVISQQRGHKADWR